MWSRAACPEKGGAPAILSCARQLGENPKMAQGRAQQMWSGEKGKITRLPPNESAKRCLYACGAGLHALKRVGPPPFSVARGNWVKTQKWPRGEPSKCGPVKRGK